MLAIIALLAVLAALITPAYLKVVEASRSAKCISNLRQIGVGIMGYAAENNGIIPPFREGTYTTMEYVGNFELDGTLGSGAGWGGYIYPYLGGRHNWKVFVCPSDPHASERDLTDYQSNGGLGTGASYSINAGYVGAPRGVSYIVSNELQTTSRTVRLSDLQWPSQTCIVADDSCKAALDISVGRPVGLLYAPWNGAVYPPQHNRGLNALFGDGHAAAVPLSFFEIRTNPMTGPDSPERRFWFVK